MDEKFDYEKIGFSKDLTRKSRKVTELMEDKVSIQTPQVPTGSLSGAIAKEKVQRAVVDLVQISGTTTVGPFVLGNNAGVRLTSTLSDNENPNRVMLGVCEITAYIDEVGIGANVIPYGSNTSHADWKIYTSHDFHQNAILASTGAGKKLSYTYNLYNESGSSQTIFWYVRWRYTGTATASSL